MVRMSQQVQELGVSLLECSMRARFESYQGSVLLIKGKLIDFCFAKGN